MILRILWQSALLLAIAAAAAWATYRWNPNRPELYLVIESAAGPNEVTLADAQALEKKPPGVLWIDARRRQEFEKGHVPGALLLNLYEWEELMRPVIEKMQEYQEYPVVIIYCDSKQCDASKQIREKMIGFGMGTFDIRVLHGGWPAWQAGNKGG